MVSNNYTDDSIVSLKGLEKVTQMPNIYVGNRNSNRSLFQMGKEIVDNSIDEASIIGKDFETRIVFFHNKERTKYQCLVIDNGRGIPVNKILPSFTEEATSGKYKIDGKNSAYKRTTGVYGRGSKAVAGLSTIFCALSSQENETGSGLLLVKNAKIERTEINNICFKRGTLVFHEPSPEYFYTIDTFMGEGLQLFLDYVEFILAFEENANITIITKEGLVNNSLFNKNIIDIHSYFISIDGSNKNEKIIFKSNKDFSMVDYMKNKLNIKDDIIYEDFISYDDPESLSFKINLLVSDDFNNLSNTKFVSAVNNSPINTPESHHIFVLLNIIKERLCKFSDSPKIQKFLKESYKLPIYLSVGVYWNDMEFEDLLKLTYRDTKFSVAYYSVLQKIFNSNEYVDKFNTLYEILKEHIEEQYNKFTFKAVAGGNNKNISSKLNKSKGFFPCKIKDKEIAELYIVEGDTAANLLSSINNKDMQAIWTLGGKTINVLKTDVEEGFKNKVFKDLSLVIGLKPGDPIENINYKKIFIATDPDAHGAHIINLIIGNLYSINPAIIDNGYVNIIITPQYSLTYKKYRTFIKDFDTLFIFKVKAIFKFLFDFKIRINDTIIALEKEKDIVVFCKMIYNLAEKIINNANNLGMLPQTFEMFVQNYNYLFDIIKNQDILKTNFNCDKIEFDEKANSIYILRNKEDIVVPMNNVMRTIRNNILNDYLSICKGLWEPLISVKGTTEKIEEIPMTILQIYYILENSCKDLKVSKFKGLGTMNPKDAEPICMSVTTRTYLKIKNLGNVAVINDMMGRDTNERKLL